MSANGDCFRTSHLAGPQHLLLPSLVFSPMYICQSCLSKPRWGEQIRTGRSYGAEPILFSFLQTGRPLRDFVQLIDSPWLIAMMRTQDGESWRAKGRYLHRSLQ